MLGSPQGGQIRFICYITILAIAASFRLRIHMWDLEISLYIPFVFRNAPWHFLALLGSPPGQANKPYLREDLGAPARVGLRADALRSVNRPEKRVKPNRHY